MSGFWFGILALPVLAILAALVWFAWVAVAWAFHEWFDPSLRDGRWAYAYQVTSASGRDADRFIGATFIESHYRGKAYTYRIEFNGVDRVWARAVLKGRGTGVGKWADWDQATAEELDKALEQ